MASHQYHQLRFRGFSKAYLHSPVGSPTVVRQAILNGHLQANTCRVCGGLYADFREHPAPLENSDGKDYRRLYSDAPTDVGVCSSACATQLTGDLFAN